MELSDEKKTIEEAKKNPEAFGLLYDKFYKQIFNYILRRTPDIKDAQDLTSQTFFKALKNLWKFRWQNVPFSAWLYRIATNEINDFYRKKKNIVKVGLDKIPEIVSKESVEEEFIIAQDELNKKEEFLRLHKSIERLQPIYQTVIVLHFFEKKKISEISQIINKPEGTIKSQIHRALGQLKELIGE